MLISLDWIKDFTPIPELSPSEISSQFTLSTAEVEGVSVTNDYLEKIKVAEIVQIDKHPDADKIRLVTFNFGKNKSKQVVCGASNVKVGLKTPYAPLGTLLPNGLLLEPKKIRGFLSEGMLCSEEELALAQKSDGIMELKPDTPVGMSMLEYFDAKKDVILDVDNKSLTHRPDLWGMYGIAREFSASFNQPLKNPYDKKWSDKLKKLIGKAKSPITVKVDQDSAGLAYFGLSVDEVSVGESPGWIKERLLSVGLRPINNIVDISNYVMLELGMPLHIFDRKSISGEQVHIKKLSNDTNFKTLDEIDRQLVSGDTVISDNKGPLVLAGIMGGLNSGVTQQTNSIFIEVANWQAAKVRRTSTRLGLRTDSSQRYEKTLDSQLCERTLLRTLELIIELCPKAKVVGKIEYDGEDLSTHKDLELEISHEQIETVLGTSIESSRVKDIFNSLDFKISEKGSAYHVKVPSYRSTKDIQLKEDLIEEIGRIVGYDNIAESSPALDILPVNLSSAQKLHRNIRDFMVLHSRSFEVMTYPLIGKKLIKNSLFKEEDFLKLINPVSQDQECMRTSLVPLFLDVASKNAKNQSDFRFFELGRVYKATNKENKFCEENSMLGVAYFSKTKTPFVELLNDLDKLFLATNIPGQFCDSHPKFTNEVISEQWQGLHPFEYQNIRLMGKMKGAAFSVHPLLLRSFKIKGHLSIALLDLSPLEAKELKEKTSYKPLPKFPPSMFDWTVLADNDSRLEDVLNIISKSKIKELESCKIVTTFQLDNKKAITLRATFSDPEKTLDGDFLTTARNKLVELCEKSNFPLKS